MTTIADVAKAAGVSISTVSYVMSGKRTISPETRERVARAIEELEFRPHAGARSLASRATNVIGLQAPLRTGVDVHVVMQIVAGVVREARAHEYDILLLASDDASGLERAARSSLVDAFLVMDVESDDTRLATISSLAVPTVLIGLPAGADAVTCVDFDFEAAGALAVERFAARGHRRIALIGSPPEVVTRHTSYADRLARGFLHACAERGIEGSIHPTPSGADAARVVDDVLAEHPAVTGLFVHNEGALPHVAEHLRTRSPGQAPELIALCPPEVAHAVGGLSEVIDLPAEEIGAAAARVLGALLAGEASERVNLLEPRILPGTAG
ncbi:LacI family DNA-binding transcriptional regulator [Agromyces larvae]|uniref:LacI family transcriptional regulator n=1 Tax=Agromyces larvae TaxID=2929802 RepID=A0ABY4C2N3_9MICO|nr:LacI family DNA-binding transcriptional regulator [Agromyces larvae]UOE44233.1 LacI family transcriptional regulator [Agromyces larvae]